MKHTPENPSEFSTPVQSPHPGLQALLPRLAMIGMLTEKPPVFDDYPEAEAYLEQLDPKTDVYIVPVWAIDHTDLTASAVAKWTLTRWLH